MNIIIPLPVALRDVTHLKLLWIDVKPDAISAAFLSGRIEQQEIPPAEEGGEPTTADVFVEDPDIRQPTVRTIENREAFFGWCTSRGAETSETYGVLFNQRDVMQWIGIEEYTRRGIPLPEALQ